MLASLATRLGVQLTGAEKPNYLTMFYIYLGSNICLLIVCLQFRASNENVAKDELLRGPLEKPKVAKGIFHILKHFYTAFFS